MSDVETSRLVDMAKGNRGLAVYVQERLKELACGSGGPTAKEIARDVLSGRVDLREAVLSDTYASEMRKNMVRFAHWYSDLTPEERRRVIADTRKQLDLLGNTKSLD